MTFNILFRFHNRSVDFEPKFWNLEAESMVKVEDIV